MKFGFENYDSEQKGLFLEVAGVCQCHQSPKGGAKGRKYYWEQRQQWRCLCNAMTFRRDQSRSPVCRCDPKQERRKHKNTRTRSSRSPSERREKSGKSTSRPGETKRCKVCGRIVCVCRDKQQLESEGFQEEDYEEYDPEEDEENRLTRRESEDEEKEEEEEEEEYDDDVDDDDDEEEKEEDKYLDGRGEEEIESLAESYRTSGASSQSKKKTLKTSGTFFLSIIVHQII